MTTAAFTVSEELREDGWSVTVRAGDFVARARFPLSMGDVARDRAAILKRTMRAQDVEDLLREFGSDEDYYEWMRRS